MTETITTPDDNSPNKRNKIQYRRLARYNKIIIEISFED